MKEKKDSECIKSSNIRISVVMTTYNGEKYLKKQLLSLANQKVEADEVLIFDDSSTDSTVSLIEGFIKSHDLKNWHVYVNKNNLGWRKNFIQGILKTKGDIIFLSDQDDIWLENKIGNMVEIMVKHENIQVLSCNVKIKYSDHIQPKVNIAGRNYKRKNLEKVELGGLTYGPIRPGCAYAFRKEILPEIQRLWFDNLAHDSLIWSIGMMKESLYIVNEFLMYQVRHEGNNTPSNEKTYKRRKELVDSRKELAFYLLKNMPYISDRNKKWLTNYINVAKERLIFLNNGGIFRYICLLKYLKYYPKLTSWLGDYIAFRSKRKVIKCLL